MRLASDIPDGAEIPRRSLLTRRVILHSLGLAVAALATWLVWRAYRDPGFVIDLANAFLLC
ncbi:MAG TPA: hypothetical protein VNG69_11470 [Casimicrobiaceae bacterium]|nr:hypothetical protein [Casimicrobiaceae bacterium]